ncbi:MAG: flagellar protein FlbB [Spirochaetales bacterium]|nr:flagellar protein FlbB [Spirochaetales bacterium]
MARYSYIGSGTKIILLILVLITLVVAGFVWFDYLGLYDGKDVLAPLLGILGFQKRIVVKDVEDPLLLERERLKKQTEALEILEEELDNRETGITDKEKEISQMIGDIEEQEKALTERENSFNERVEQYDKRRRNLEQSSEYLVGMEPDKAVKILLEMDDVDIIDIFRITEEIAEEEGEVSLVAYWLSLMPEVRAAELNRKMARKTNS